MIINHNMNAMNAHRSMSANTVNAGKSMEKLSSGLRINRAGDDAAGLAISEKMRGQIRGLDQASRNAQDGISLIQTAEGALNETHSILQRMNELATQAANGTLQTEDRTAIKDELSQLNSEIDRISSSTTFNGKALLNGSFGVQEAAGNTLAVSATGTGITAIDFSGAKASTTYALAFSATDGYVLSDGAGNSQSVSLANNTAGSLNFDKLGIKVTVNTTADSTSLAGLSLATSGTAAVDIQIGANSTGSEKLGLTIANMSSTALGTNVVNVDDTTNSTTSMDTIKNAISTVSAQRSKLGAAQNRLEHTINNLGTASENLTSAESRIRDVDMAKEMMNFSKNNILSQAAQAMLAQANQQPQGVLQLLR
jgi:flagellin